MKKALIILGSVFGGLLLLCCGGGVTLYLLADNTYAAPEDACAMSAIDSLSDLGGVKEKQVKDVMASGRTYDSCVITLDGGESDRTLTVAVDAPSMADDARSHYDTTRTEADSSPLAGAVVEEVADVGTKAFIRYTFSAGQLVFELTYYDGNLYVSLNLVSAGGLQPDQTRSHLIAIADSLMTDLELQSTGGDWD